mmetsp:Transcript_794/g.1577  ORF Transcript_794/g.1577 Transcript_794/m.1577 type:complete len:94 (-) Transcript_794:441-722(-)
MLSCCITVNFFHQLNNAETKKTTNPNYLPSFVLLQKESHQNDRYEVLPPNRNHQSRLNEYAVTKSHHNQPSFEKSIHGTNGHVKGNPRSNNQE